MKYFLLLILSCTFVLAIQEKYSIQVLSVEDNVSITQGFMQKVKQTGMSYKQVMSDGKQRVCLGEFMSRKEAEKALKDIQRLVSKDAFVCKVEGATESLMEPRQKMQHAMLMAQARSLKIAKKDESPVEEKELRSIEPVEVKGPVQKIVITKVDPRKMLSREKEVKTEEKLSKETSRSLFCKTTKSALREHETSNALSFYKNSAYYHFADQSGF